MTDAESSSEGSAQPLPEMTTTTEAPPPGAQQEAERLARQLTEAAQQARQAAEEASAAGARAAELREAAQEAEEAASRLADAAEAAEAAQPSLGRTLLNAALWAGGVFAFTWGLTKLVGVATEAQESRERFPRGTEEAHTEPTTQQPQEA